MRGPMINKPRIHDLVDDYRRFKNWLNKKKNLTITKAREIGIESIIDEYDDWVIDQKYTDKRSFQKRTGINYSTFRDWVKRNIGKAMSELTEDEKDDLVIDYKVERGFV